MSRTGDMSGHVPAIDTNRGLPQSQMTTTNPKPITKFRPQNLTIWHKNVGTKSFKQVQLYFKRKRGME